MGSADWMPRNLEKRVEITFPVEDEAIKSRVIEILQIQLADTLKAHILQPDGTYAKPDLRGRDKLSAQETFMKQALKLTKQEEKGKERVFIPKTKAD